ncbi:hypothetical protein BBK36DRAFT_1183166 [Trichoderma citrinoviride]|uniref:Uncharacterized protein n=1 Tax=Trichoderma citrinoviride TaxID=58853 RepID=A0A2T4B1S6_9HYPO|nr:hypothetical protein BBK36DRAFT_1183166 [Trichoderma citrinoviride]PTB63188.1 hypothetical protein BBK36DRAFT_1183166 [Trichoderma citrinoviride]
METATPTSSTKAVSPRSKIPIIKSSPMKPPLKVPLKLQRGAPNYAQIAYFKVSDSLQTSSRAPSLKALDITRLPDDLKLIGPENWAPWSSAMMAIAELSGFDVTVLEETPRAVHVSCWHNAEKTREEVREGKMLGLLIKFNISAHMNDLVSLTMDGYEVWKVLKLYCARFVETDPSRMLKRNGGCIRIS